MRKFAHWAPGRGSISIKNRNDKDWVINSRYTSKFAARLGATASWRRSGPTSIGARPDLSTYDYAMQRRTKPPREESWTGEQKRGDGSLRFS